MAYDESTVFFPLGMSTEDYFIVIQLAKKKNMTRSQFIMECIRQAILREQEEWRRQEEERRMLEKVKAMDPQPQPGDEPKRAGEKKRKEGEG
jgi:hypothetical protein